MNFAQSNLHPDGRPGPGNPKHGFDRSKLRPPTAAAGFLAAMPAGGGDPYKEFKIEQRAIEKEVWECANNRQKVRFFFRPLRIRQFLEFRE